MTETEEDPEKKQKGEEQEISKYFIGRGKKAQDNELINKMIKAQEKIKMPKI